MKTSVVPFGSPAASRVVKRTISMFESVSVPSSSSSGILMSVRAKQRSYHVVGHRDGAVGVASDCEVAPGAGIGRNVDVGRGRPVRDDLADSLQLARIDLARAHQVGQRLPSQSAVTGSGDDAGEPVDREQYRTGRPGSVLGCMYGDADV